MSRVISSTDLVWRTVGDELTLHLGRGKSLLSVAPDKTYPGMWRIIQGEICSDMVNLSRAKDAALSWALAALNKYQARPPEPR